MKVAIILGNDLLKPAKDIRAYREALAITKAGYGYSENPTIEINDENDYNFLNINTKEDLEKAKKKIK